MPEENSAVLGLLGRASVEFTEPSALTSLKSRVYRAEVSAGGGPVLPNWAALSDAAAG